LFGIAVSSTSLAQSFVDDKLLLDLKKVLGKLLVILVLFDFGVLCGNLHKQFGGLDTGCIQGDFGIFDFGLVDLVCFVVQGLHGFKEKNAGSGIFCDKPQSIAMLDAEERIFIHFCRYYREKCLNL